LLRTGTYHMRSNLSSFPPLLPFSILCDQTDMPMQATAQKIPDSLEDDELLRLPATWEEYLDVIDNDVPYAVQFLNDEIIMSQA
jgi:hypothetical protein